MSKRKFIDLDLDGLFITICKVWLFVAVISILIAFVIVLMLSGLSFILALIRFFITNPVMLFIIVGLVWYGLNRLNAKFKY